MGERLLCKQEVIGSIPFTSTTDRTTQSVVRVEARQARACAPGAPGQGRGTCGDELLIFDREMTSLRSDGCPSVLIFDR